MIFFIYKKMACKDLNFEGESYLMKYRAYARENLIKIPHSLVGNYA